MGRFPSEAFSGTVVQVGHDVLYVFLVDLTEIGSLREVRANQAMGVFVQAPLPRVVWVCEVPLGIQCFADLLMPSELLPVVVGEGVDPGLERLQCSGDGLGDGLSRFVNRLDEYAQPTLALG